MPSSSMVGMGCNGCTCPTAPSRGHKTSTVSCKHTTTITGPSGHTVRFQDEVVHHTSGSSSNGHGYPRLTDSYRDDLSGATVRCYSDDDSDDSDDDIARRRRQRRLEGGSTSTRHTSSHRPSESRSSRSHAPSSSRPTESRSSRSHTTSSSRPTESRSSRSHTTSSRLTAIPESRMIESSSRPTDGYGRSGATDLRDMNYPTSSRHPTSSRPSSSTARPSGSVRPSESRSHRPSTTADSSRRSTNAHPSIHESRSGSSRVGGEVVVYDDHKGKSSRRDSVSKSVKGLFSRR